MKTLGLALLVLVLAAPVALAGIVIHDGTKGIVATCYAPDFHTPGWMLDSTGMVWSGVERVWEPSPELRPPLPVSDIKFWERTFVVSMHDTVRST